MGLPAPAPPSANCTNPPMPSRTTAAAVNKRNKRRLSVAATRPRDSFDKIVRAVWRAGGNYVSLLIELKRESAGHFNSAFAAPLPGPNL